ncbi:MAG: MBL fold metallo-hydrolase [Thermoproteota archaeon]|nr:MBL fold metallo-hydrolase [Thermoproteota archaeon]
MASGSSVREVMLPMTNSDAAADLTKGSILFIGNATLLIRCAGFTFLTDPTFIHMHEKVHLGPGLYSERLTNPALEISQLPPIDFVLLSHFHGDHFDQAAVRGLSKSLTIVTNEHAIEELSARGFSNFEKLDKWQSVAFVKGDFRLKITATPGRHGPLPVSMFMPQVTGSIIEFQSAAGANSSYSHFRTYITGDTTIFDDIKDIPKHYPDIDLAMFHLGGTTVLGIVVTMDAKEGIEMLRIIKPKKVIPIHYNDYDVFKSSLEEFQNEVRNAHLEDRVHYLRHGDTYNFHMQTVNAR